MLPVLLQPYIMTARYLFLLHFHPVFELVPHTVHERADNLYSVIGRPEITAETFWDVYLELLRQLHLGQDEELANIISSHQNSL